MLRLFSLFIICCFLHGCASDKPKRKPPTKPRALECNGETMLLNIYGPHNAALTYKSKTYELDRSVKASGVRYARKNTSVWNRGLEYRIRVDGNDHVCFPAPEAEF